MSAAQVRGVLLGRVVEGVEVVRQARRVSGDDTDELVLADARGAWWVARRTSATLNVWLYIGDTEAEEGFERLAAAASRGGEAWVEAQQQLLSPPA